MLATVAERISEAILDLVNAHLAKPKGLKPVGAVNSLLGVVELDGNAAVSGDKIKKGGCTKLVALVVNIVVGAFIVFVFDLNLVSLILAGASQTSAAGVEALGETSGQILSVFIVALGADGAHQLIKRVTPDKKTGV
jgi:hypothetical protein